MQTKQVIIFRKFFEMSYKEHIGEKELFPIAIPMVLITDIGQTTKVI